VHIGLGDAAACDSLIIRWPSGREEIHLDVRAGIHRFDEQPSAVGAADLPSPAAGEWRVTGPSPQPARGAQTLEVVAIRPVELEVSVYDVAGRRVRALHRGPIPAGTTSLVWDGTGGDGRHVPAGVYLLRITGGDRRVTARSIRID
jgi:hypothetical protein